MAKNTTTTALSANAKAIVDAFINQNIFEPQRANALVVELYSRRKDADQDIIAQAKSNLLPCSLTLSEEQYLVLDAEYDNVVKYCHTFIVGLEKAQLNGSFTHFPSELVELCSRIISCKEEESVYLPYAGYCDMAYALDAKTVTGFDVNPSTVAFNTILFGAYGIDGGITRCDSPSPEINKGQKYDHIISCPPHFSAKENKIIAEYAQELLQNNLSDGGDMSLILPLGDMSSLPWISFRRYLLQNKTEYSVMTISLPAVFLPVTGVKFCLMVIEKAKNPDGTFFFMDADRKEFYTESKENRRQPLLKVDSILESVRVLDERYIREIDVENNVLFGKYYLDSFAPSRYFVYDNLPELKEGYEYYTLWQLVQFLKIDGMAESDLDFGRRPGRYIRISCLHDNYMSCDIDYDSITTAPIPSSAYCGYANGAYAAFVNGKIKVGQIKGMHSSSGRFDDFDPYSDSKIIYIDGSVAHFAPKQNGAAQQDYILRELMSDYVLEQAKRLAYGTVKQEMRVLDFCKLKIAVPSIEVQDEILKQDRIDAVAKAGIKIDEINEKFRKDVHMMKHSIGQTLANLGNWLSILNDARKEGEGVLNDDAETGGLMKIKVADIYDRINTVYQKLHRQISTIDQGYGKTCSTILLGEFIETYVKSNPYGNVSFIYRGAPSQQWEKMSDQSRSIVQSEPTSVDDWLALADMPLNPAIRFPQESLTTIFDNIVSNAVSHGLKDTDKPMEIKFEIEDYGSEIVLLISNNGTPLSSGFSAEDIFTYGVSTGGGEHAGIGAYQVRNLMEEFGGHVEIISAPEEEFPITYRLTFLPAFNITKFDFEK